jgi:hypothetical protein
VRLFSAEAILAHTLVLTPLVGSILAALNHRRLGARAAFRRTLLLFAVPSALLIVAPMLVSERLAPFAQLVVFAWTIFVARRFFLEHQVLFARHEAAGGQKARWYWPTLLTFGVLVLGLLAVFATELL